MKVYATYGRTESGDYIPVLLWDNSPPDEVVHAKYAELLPFEYGEGCPVSYSIDETSLPMGVRDELDKLNRLECAGVDNWDGYEWAMQDAFWDES